MATISQQLIAGLQNPSMLAPLGRAAEAIGYYPTQIKKQGMLEQIQNAKTEEDRAKALIEYGKLTRNDNMILKGTDLMRQAKQSGVANQVASLTNVLSNPILNKDQSDLLRSHIEQYASKAGLNLAPVISGMNTAATRQIANLDQEAVNAVNSGVSRQAFEKQYAGQGPRWDAAKVNKSRQDDALDAIANKPRIAEINRINAQIAQESLKPSKDQDAVKLQALENILVSLRQQVGDSKAYESVGVAAASIQGAADREFKQLQDQQEKNRLIRQGQVEAFTNRAMSSADPVNFVETNEKLNSAEFIGLKGDVLKNVAKKQEELMDAQAKTSKTLSPGELKIFNRSKSLLLKDPLVKEAWDNYNKKDGVSLEKQLSSVKRLREEIKKENERLQSREYKESNAKMSADTAIRYFLKDDEAQRWNFLSVFGVGRDVYDVVEMLVDNPSLEKEYNNFKERLTEEYIQDPTVSPAVAIPKVIRDMQIDVPGEIKTQERQKEINVDRQKFDNLVDKQVIVNLKKENSEITDEEISVRIQEPNLRFQAIQQVREREAQRHIEEANLIRRGFPGGMFPTESGESVSLY